MRKAGAEFATPMAWDYATTGREHQRQAAIVRLRKMAASYGKDGLSRRGSAEKSLYGLRGRSASLRKEGNAIFRPPGRVHRLREWGSTPLVGASGGRPTFRLAFALRLRTEKMSNIPPYGYRAQFPLGQLASQSERNRRNIFDKWSAKPDGKFNDLCFYVRGFRS